MILGTTDLNTNQIVAPAPVYELLLLIRIMLKKQYATGS